MKMRIEKIKGFTGQLLASFSGTPWCWSCSSPDCPDVEHGYGEATTQQGALKAACEHWLDHHTGQPELLVYDATVPFDGTVHAPSQAELAQFFSDDSVRWSGLHEASRGDC